MKANFDGKAKRLNINRGKNDKLRDIADEELVLRKIAVKGQQIHKAREYFAASKIQAIVKGFLDRRFCERERRFLRALNILQRVMKGKLGRMRWKREYWRSVSVVKTDTALDELIERSTALRRVTAGGRNKYDWTEYFDPLSDSFWYFNSLTRHNTWNCPLPFQTTLVCPWEGFYDYGGRPDMKEACRCPFSNLQAYQNHLRTAHVWYCVACDQRNTGLNFPKCHLCGNRYNVDGVDGEKELHESMRKVRSKLETFIYRDVTDKERGLYNIRDRLMGLANERENAKEAMQQFALELEMRGLEGKLTAAEKKRGQELLVEMNEKYLDRAIAKYGAEAKNQAAVVSDMSNQFLAQSMHERKKAKEKARQQQLTTIDNQIIVRSSSDQSQREKSTTADRKTHSRSAFRKSFLGNIFTGFISEPNSTGFKSSNNEDLSPKKDAFYDGFYYAEEDEEIADEAPQHKTVVLAVTNRIEQERGGAEGDRQRYRHPSTKGVFAESDFDMFMSMHEDNAASNLKLNLYDDDSSSGDDDDDTYDDDDNNTGNEDGADDQQESSSRPTTRDGSRPVTRSSVKKQKKLQKMLVCMKFLGGSCNLLSCPLAHPGVRDNSRPKRKTIKQPDGSKRKAPFVFICPDSDGVHTNNCVRGKSCRNYHVYVRPATQDIILKLYPTASGHRTKEFAYGAKLTGNVDGNKFNGYGVMTWPDGSTYMGDWKDDLRHGRGVHRTADGTEYIGTYWLGKRHGWGVMTNHNGDEYAGEFREGKIQGAGKLTSANGDIYEGSFLNNLYDGIGRFKKSNGDVFLGYCTKGMAQGLGIIVLASGEKYKGHFSRNARHGRGACAYANGARYAGQWYYGCHEGFGVFISPNGREKYIGEWSANRKHGKGRYYFENGDFYDGEFHKDKAKGVGTYYHTNGNIYTGQWDNDMRNGRGTYVFANGSKYTGNWTDNNIDGKGRFDFANGAFYRGTFDRNVKHGKGIYTWPTGNSYRGEFRYENIAGAGEMKYVMGHRYVGAWLDNMKHGYGVFYYANGSIYEGEYVKDIRHGKGKITFNPNSPVEESYDGDWVDDEWTGEGTYHYRHDEGTVYTGSWVKGVREGTGTLAFKDGSYYRGDFKENQMWGRGVFVGADGTQYDGDWRRNMRQGNGTAIDLDGCIYHGEFWGNMRQGKGQITRPDGSIYTGTWEANFIVGTGKVTIPVGDKEKKDGLKKQVTLRVFGY